MTRVGCRRTIEAMQKDIVHSITARGQECESNYIARLKYCAMFSVECDRGLQWRAHCGIISTLVLLASTDTSQAGDEGGEGNEGRHWGSDDNQEESSGLLV